MFSAPFSSLKIVFLGRLLLPVAMQQAILKTWLGD